MDDRDKFKILRVVLFLIPIIIMFIMSFFFGKQKAAAHFFRFRSSLRLIIFAIIFIALAIWTFYVIVFDKNEKDKKNIKIDLFMTLIFFIIFLVVFIYWRWSMNLSNNKAAGVQYINTSLNAVKTSRNMFR